MTPSRVKKVLTISFLIFGVFRSDPRLEFSPLRLRRPSRASSSRAQTQGRRAQGRSRRPRPTGSLRRSDQLAGALAVVVIADPAHDTILPPATRAHLAPIGHAVDPDRQRGMATRFK